MSLRVKLLFMAPVALLPIALIAASKEIRASSVQWKEHFGTYSAEPHTSFCLMARGFFRSPIENVEAVTSAWLKKHRNAKLIRVSSMPASTKDPQALLTFVWVVDGDESLNLELVRQGCFDSRTQILGDEQRLEVPQADYDAFTKKLTIAGEYAHQHNFGIWSEPQERDDSND